MAISKGNAAIGKLYVGSKEVEKAFVGDKMIYQSGIPFDPVFANNDWATIRTIVRSGNIPSTWVVGDTKDITLSTGQTISYRICDMQAGRYALADGSGSSNMVLEPLTLISNQKAKMNVSNTNAGGFADSQLRINMMNVFFGWYPADVRSAMSEVRVLSGTGRSTSSGTSSSANHIFLAAEMEMFSTRTYSIGTDECPLGQFDYYKTHNTNAARQKTKDGTNNNYWLRSPQSGDGTSFCAVLYTGAITHPDATDEYNIAPFFAI